MGSSSSKPLEDDFNRRSNSVRKSTQSRRSSLSKTDQIENIYKVTVNLKIEIDIFAGSRTDSRYKEFQKILATLATELQKIKNVSKKPQNIARCDEVVGEIQNCLQRLETRVNFNEQNENTLDLASVESNSFIHQRPSPPALLNREWAAELQPPSKQRQHKFDHFRSLENLEQQTQNLEKEIKLSMQLEDTKKFVIHEKKIKLLYTDLELIRVDEHTPLSEKKAAIGKKLIKHNNQIKNYKKTLKKRLNEQKLNEQGTTQDGSGLSKPLIQKKTEDQVDVMTKMEHLLGDLEIQALTFEGVKGDKRYKELEQILESYWTKLYSMDVFGDEERKMKSLTVERTKNILQELFKRAEENERQLNAIQSIHKIHQKVQGVKKEAEAFKGTTTDPSYIKLDQELRGFWAKLNEVEEPNEHVKRSKARVISDIQYVLKKLSEDANNGDIYENVAVIMKPDVATKTNDTIEEEIVEHQLLKQVAEFETHWNRLNYNLEVQKIHKSETAMSIIDTLEKVEVGVNKKKNAFAKIEKRKSNSSLVIARVIDNTDQVAKLQPTRIYKSAAATAVTDSETYYENHKPLSSFKPAISLTYQSQYQPPDLIQQQAASPPISKPMETEIKVQPTVKVIGEMQRVGTEAKSLLQQIRQSNCAKQDSEFKHFETRLKNCQLTLQSIEYNKRSDTIESNRRRASKTINEAFRALEDKGSPKVLEQDKTAAIRSSRAQEIMDIDAGIQYFRQQIKTFSGVTKDKQYEKIKQGLSDSLSKLQVIDDVHMSKQESIRQIQQYHQELETKLAENQVKVKLAEQNAELRRQANQDFKEIMEQVQKLRAQVERFSGVYDGLPYKQIAGSLESCFEKLEVLEGRGDDKLENAKLLTKQKIRKYLRILEAKSTKASFFDQGIGGGQDQGKPEQPEPYQAYVVKDEVAHLKASVEQQHNSVAQQYSSGVPQPDVVHRQKVQRQSQVTDEDSPHHRINSLRDKLVEVKNKTETFSGKFKDGEYSEIENELLGYFEELKGIDDRGHQSVIISKDQYADYIEKLLMYFEEKAKTTEVYSEEKSQKVTESEEATISNQTPIVQPSQKFKVVDPTEELAAIEEKILELKRQVDGLDGTASEGSYKDLEEVLSAHRTKLEAIQVGNVAHVRERKSKLVQELENCAQLLNEKLKLRSEVGPKEDQEQLDKINGVLKELKRISEEVNSFSGVKNDKDYCYLDELLIKLTIKLDNTPTYGNNELRDIRKRAIKEIQRNMDILVQRAAPMEDPEAVVTASEV